MIETNQETIIDNQLYFITGQLSFDDYSGSLNMKASSIMDLEKTRTRYSKGIELLIRESKTNDDTLEKLSSFDSEKKKRLSMQAWKRKCFSVRKGAATSA